MKQRTLPASTAPPLCLNLVPVTQDLSTFGSASAFRVTLSPEIGGDKGGQLRLLVPFIPSRTANHYLLSAGQCPQTPVQPDVTLGYVTGDHFDGWLEVVASKGYGELDIVAYTKEKRPYVNRLTMSAPSPSQPFLAMLQEFSEGRQSVPAPITDSTNSAPSGSDFNNSSSNETDTMSSNSMKKGNETSGSSDFGSNEDISDSDIVSFIAASSAPLPSPPRPPSSTASSESSVSDRSIVNFLANSKEPLDDVVQPPPPRPPGPVPTPDPYLVAARIDLETAWRAAWALSFGGGSVSLPHSSSQTGSLANNGSQCSYNPPDNKKSSHSSSSSTKSDPSPAPSPEPR